MIYGSVPYGSTPLASIISLLGPEIIVKRLKFYYRNILETSTVIVTSENASYPAYRLFDRNIGLIYKGATAPSSFLVYVAQDLGNQYPIDTIIVPDGHNLNDLVLTLKYSPDNINWTQACAWIGETGQMVKHFDSTLACYWAFNIFNPSSPPEFHELFLTSTYELERGPNWDYEWGKQENVSRLESKSGEVQKTKWGDERQIRNYPFAKIGEAQRLTLETIRTELNGIKNFYFEDLEGNLFFAEFPEGIPSFNAEPIGRWGHRLRIREVLP